MNRALRALKHLAAGLGALLALLLVVLLAAWGAANTDAGRAWLAARLAAALGSATVDAEVEGLAGPLPQRIALDRVVLRDRDGTWLTLRSLELTWRPGALLAGRLDIARIHAASIALSRVPAGAAGDEAAEAAPFEVPHPPLPVRLDFLAVERLELGAAVLGQAAVFAVEGRAAAPRDGRLTSRLNVRRLDEPGGRLDIEATYEPGPRRLALEGRLRAEAGGVLADALALPPGQAIEASLTGGGPLDAWAGRGELRFGRDAGATMDVRVTDGAALRVDGRADVQALLPGDAASLLGGAATVVLRARRAGAAGVRLDEVRLATRTAAIRLSGRLDGGAGTLALEGDFELRDPAPFAALAGISELSGVSGGLRAHGPITAPDLEAEVAVDRLALPEATATDATAALTFSPAGTLSRGRLALRTAADRVATPAPPLAGLSPAPLSAALDGDLDLDAMTLSGATLSLDGPDITARLDGGADLTTGQGDAAFDLRLGDLARLDPFLGLGLSGRGRLNGHLAVGGATPARATILGEFESLAWQAPFAHALASDAVTLATDITLAQDGALTLSRTSIDSEAAHAAGRLALPAGFDRLDGAFELSLADAGVLDEAVGTQLAGAAEGTVRLSGPTADPAATATLKMTDAAVADVPLGRLQLTVDARHLAGGASGTLTATVDAPPLGAARASGDFALEAEAFRLTALDAEAPGLKLSGGRLSVPLAGGALTGEAEVAASDLSATSAAFGLPIAGRGRMTLALAAGREGQALALDGRLRDVAYTGGDQAIEAKSVALEADLDNVLAAPTGTARLSVEDAKAGAAELRTVTLEADGSLAQAELRLQAEGDAFGPLRLSAAGTLSRRDAATTFELTQFAGEVQSRKLRLARPATFHAAADELAVRDLAMSVAGGALRIDAVHAGGSVEATAEVEDLPLELSRLLLARPEFAGTLNGRLRLSGPAARPEGSLDLDLRDVRIAGADLPPLDAVLNGRLQKGEVSASGEVTGVSQTPVRLSASLPVDVSLAPFAVGLRETAPLRAEVAWQGDVGALMPWIPVDGHRLTGTGEVALRLEGPLDDVKPRGHVSLREATYENFDAGTLLTGLQMRIEGDGRALRIASFTANDGADGRVTLDGGLTLDPDAGYPLDLAATARGATLIRRDEITARTNADLTLTGPLADLMLAGRVTVERAEARLPDQLPPEVASLDVVEVGGGRTADTPDDTPDDTADDTAAKAEDAPAGRLGLDLQVVVPNRFFLRGRGLDSEWSGELTVTGTADAPVINGQLESVRGQIDFLGKVFKLNRGTVAFAGGRDIDPDLQAVAEHTGRDITVTATLEGTVQNPTLSLGSTPELPQDEVLARLMFGKSVADLSALEAGQLGAAVADLSMGGGGPGLLDRLRSFVGVDVLRFGTSAEGDPSLTAGQYITEDVFIGVEQGAAGDSSAATVELGLSDNISVDSQVGVSGRSDVGIQFKWDY